MQSLCAAALLQKAEFLSVSADPLVQPVQDTVHVLADTVFVASSSHSGADLILLTVQVLTLLALIFYVWKTAAIARGTMRLADETRESRKALLAPRVVVYCDPSEIHIAQIVIENVGPGTATNVRLRFDPQLQTTQERLTTAFFDTAKFLPPGQKLVSIFDTWEAYLTSDLPQTYAVTVTYEGLEDGQTYSSEYILETKAMKDRRQLARHGMHELVERLDGLGRKLERELRNVRDEVAAIKSSDVFAFSHAGSIEAACAEIAAVWSLVKASASTQDVFFGSDSIAASIRRAALAGLLAWDDDKDNEAVRSALINVALVASQRRHLGDSWDEDLKKAMAELQSVCRGGDARYG